MHGVSFWYGFNAGLHGHQGLARGVDHTLLLHTLRYHILVLAFLSGGTAVIVYWMVDCGSVGLQCKEVRENLYVQFLGVLAGNGFLKSFWTDVGSEGSGMLRRRFM